MRHPCCHITRNKKYNPQATTDGGDHENLTLQTPAMPTRDGLTKIHMYVELMAAPLLCCPPLLVVSIWLVTLSHMPRSLTYSLSAACTAKISRAECWECHARDGGIPIDCH